MKCLSLWQPWASMMSIAVKQIETRTWRCNHTGPLAIHAAQRKDPVGRALFSHQMYAPHFNLLGYRSFDDLPFGAVVCIVDVVSIDPAENWATHLAVTGAARELGAGDFSPGRWAWVTDPSKKIVLKDPVFMRGRQGLFDISLPAEA